METTIEKQEIERIILNFALEAQRIIPSQLQKPKKKVVVIAGPTACGKTRFAISLAKLIGGEIISGDSMQVYRSMDIGTAKVMRDECEEIPHHLIDIRDLSEPFNVVDFYYEARHCCQEILARERVPIIAGGSGFYLHSLIYGPPGGPPSVPELRKDLEEQMQVHGPKKLYEQLKQLDPQYANTISINDRQKIVRALEILSLTGKKISKISWKGRRKPQNYDFRCWFLYRPRESIYKRVDRRCEEMLSRGLLCEVEELEKTGLRENPSASQSIGYRQALEFLKTDRSSDDYARFVEEFKKASRHYVKRQFTWFRKEPLFRWLDLDLHDHEVALEIVRQDFEMNLRPE